MSKDIRERADKEVEALISYWSEELGSKDIKDLKDLFIGKVMDLDILASRLRASNKVMRKALTRVSEYKIEPRRGVLAVLKEADRLERGE